MALKEWLLHKWNLIKKDPYTGEREKTQVFLIIAMQCLSAVFLIFLAIVNFTRNNMTAFWIITASWILNVPITIYTIVTKKKRLPIVVYTLAFIVIYTAAIYLGSNDGAAVLWIFALPVVNLLIFGLRPALIICTWFLILFIVLAANPTLQSFLQYPYPYGHFQHYVFVFICDIIVSFFVAFENCSSLQYQDDYQERLKEALEEERNKVNGISLQTILSINRAVEAKDQYTGEHSRRVAEVSCEIARRLGWKEDELERMYNIAVLHDIGKIGVNCDILTKTTPLTDEEFDEIKKHTVIGGEILKDVDFISGISDIIRHHHESWDGTGYPDGLKGDGIPIEARILSVADSYDAMLHGRSFRDKQSLDYIKKEFADCSGTLYDPEIVSIILDICEEAEHE